MDWWMAALSVPVITKRREDNTYKRKWVPEMTIETVLGSRPFPTFCSKTKIPDLDPPAFPRKVANALCSNASLRQDVVPMSLTKAEKWQVLHMRDKTFRPTKTKLCLSRNKNNHVSSFSDGLPHKDYLRTIFILVIVHWTFVSKLESSKNHCDQVLAIKALTWQASPNQRTSKCKVCAWWPYQTMDDIELLSSSIVRDCGGTPSPPTLLDSPCDDPYERGFSPTMRRSATRSPPQDDNDVEFYEDEDERVETFHHSSPIGPAVSLYPRGYGGRLQSDLRRSRYRLPPPPLNHHISPRRTQTPPNTRLPSNVAYGTVIDPTPRRPSSREVYYVPLGESHSSFQPEYLPQAPPTMVEISPGVHVPLRSADDTKECILRNDIMEAACFACPKALYCVQDASYVLCPDCRVVSPISHTDEDKTGDVGMGFTSETLNEVYNESFSSNYSHWPAGCCGEIILVMKEIPFDFISLRRCG